MNAGTATPLPPSLTLREAQPALEALRGAFAASGESTWRVDASAVSRLDSSALAVLLECARMAAAGGRELEILGAPARLTELAHLYGVDGLLDLAPQENAPVASIGESQVPATPVVPILR